jgi:transcriptional regulator NrdR family protein
MLCPACGAKTIVINTAADCKGVYRHRKCTKCKHKFFTEEPESSNAQYTLTELRKNQTKATT